MKPLILVLALFSAASPALGEEPRGSRMVAELKADFDGDKASETAIISEHPGDDGFLSLRIETSGGLKTESEKLVYGLDRDESDVASYGISMSTETGSSLVVSSVKDWGLSVWSHEYVLKAGDGKIALAGYRYTFGSQFSKGSCSLDLLTGKALVNGQEKKFRQFESGLESMNGLDLIRLCHKLSAQ